MAIEALALVALLATQAGNEPTEAPPTRQERAGAAYLSSLYSSLRESKSPRERALGARTTFDDPAAGGKLLRGAAEAAPADALVQMLWSSYGARWSGCTAASPCPDQTTAWARVEPDNGMAWLPSFQAQGKFGDDKAIDAEIARIAAAKRYDDHVIDAWQAYRRAVLARPMPPIVLEAMAGLGDGTGAKSEPTQEQAASIFAMSIASAMMLPMQSLIHACMRERHPQMPEARSEDCARIGRGIVQSESSVMSKRLGSALVRTSGLETAADREARRALDWRLEATAELLDEQQHPGGTAGYFTDLAATGSETRAQELLLARHGIALEPPAGWKSRY